MKYDSDMDVASVGSADVRSEQREIGMNECLFSGRLFNSVEDKVVYMAHKHSFYIPELEYVSNLEGLLQYLGSLFDVIIRIQVYLMNFVF